METRRAVTALGASDGSVLAMAATFAEDGPPEAARARIFSQKRELNTACMNARKRMEKRPFA